MSSSHITKYYDYETHNQKYKYIFLTYKYPLVLANYIFLFTYYKCVDCDKYVDNDYDCKCGARRCLFHSYMNISPYDCKTCNPDDCLNYDMFRLVQIVYEPKCTYDVKCLKEAKYGYINNVCLCIKHAKSKKIINYYNWCDICANVAIYYDTKTNKYYCKRHINDKHVMLNYVDFRRIIPKKEIIGKCHNCKKKCSILYNCECGIKRCNYCYYLNSWDVFAVNTSGSIHYIECNECCENDKPDGNSIYHNISTYCLRINCTSDITHISENRKHFYCNECVELRNNVHKIYYYCSDTSCHAFAFNYSGEDEIYLCDVHKKILI
jgi:hypothetical protein